MGDHETKNENNSESVSESDSDRAIEVAIGEITKKEWTLSEIDDLQARVRALEKALMHVQHLNTDDGSRHQNDGGWFD